MAQVVRMRIQNSAPVHAELSSTYCNTKGTAEATISSENRTCGLVSARFHSYGPDSQKRLSQCTGSASATCALTRGPSVAGQRVPEGEPEAPGAAPGRRTCLGTGCYSSRRPCCTEHRARD